MASIEPPLDHRTQPEFVPSKTLMTSQGRPRSWVDLLDYVFYVLLVLVMIVIGYYGYSFRDTIALIWPFLLQGAETTVILSVISIVLATIFGFIGALGRLSKFTIGRGLTRLTGNTAFSRSSNPFLNFAPLRFLATVYVEVIRGTPILVQLLFWFYGIGLALSNIGFDPHNIAFQFMTYLQSNSLVPDEFSLFFYGVIGLSFNYGAYLTEVFRAGISSVDRGQEEAGLSLGLSSGQALRRIILPQAFRITIPPFTNNFITLIQDTSLLSAINIVELEQQTSALAYPQTDPNVKLFIFVFGAFFYLLICYPLSLLSRYLESRFGVAY